MKNHPSGMRTSAGPEVLSSLAAAELALGMDGRGRPSPHKQVLGREKRSAASMGSERPQCADDIFDSILLEQADAGAPGCSGGKARRCVLQVDAAQSEHRDLRPAGFAQGGEAGGVGSRGLSLFEYRSENGEVGGLRFGAGDIGGGGGRGAGGGGGGRGGGGGGGGV